MLRIVDGIVFEGKPSVDRWRVSVQELGHGQTEFVATRCIDWVEDCRLGPDCIDAQVLRGEREDPDQAHKDAANAKRAARRAKARIRRLVKSMGCTRLLTLTYRANQQDEALCKRHVKEFVRRLRVVIPGFGYVAGYETQLRGAWHVHMAIHKLPLVLPASNGVKVKSYGVVRAIWRSVTGELGGNIDDADNKRRQRKLKPLSPGKLASYLSKYVTKAFEEGEDYSHRFSASKHTIPAAQVVELRSTSLRELYELAFAFADGIGVEFVPWLSPFGDTVYLASGPPAVDTSIHRRA